MKTTSSENVLSVGRSLTRNWQYFIPFKKRIGYIGWLGKTNLGDEAMYLAFKKMFSKFNILPFKNNRNAMMFKKISKKNLYNTVFLGGGNFRQGCRFRKAHSGKRYKY
jgi:exopolysaccharide biosynthesis predicted pyruvyltransferase EpsI